MGQVKDGVAPPAYDQGISLNGSPPQLASSSLSLHSLDPPQYQDEPDHEAGSTDESSGAAFVQDRHIPGAMKPTKDGEIRTMDPLLSSDASSLYKLLQSQSSLPPQPIVRLTGTHREVTKRDNKEQETTVTDFDIKIDCSYIFKVQEENRVLASQWYKMEVVSDTELALRGGLVKRRLREPDAPDVENVGPTDLETRVRLWCHRFCAAASHRWFPLVFRFRRKLVNWDTELIERHLTAQVRATGYRGDMCFSFKLQNPGFSIYSAHWMNRARTNDWIWWACVILQLWIFCWPILWLCTGTFDGVSTRWFYKVPIHGDETGRHFYVNESEEQWLATWGETIADAAFARRQDWVTEADILALRQARERNQERRPSQQTGNSFVDAAVGVFTGIHSAVRESDRVTGWGESRNKRSSTWTVSHSSDSRR